MNRTPVLRTAVALSLAFALVLGTVPAYGAMTPAVVHSDPVPSHAFIGVVDLYSLSATDAAAAITSASAVPALKPITVKGDGHTMTFSAKSAVYVDVAAILDQAYAATDTVTPFDLKPVYSINGGVVWGWMSKISRTVNDKPVNALRKLSKKKLVVYAEKSGHTVIQTTMAARINAAIASEIASPGLSGRVVWTPLKTTKPKITRKNIGKAILIRLSKFTITLYNGAKVEKSYRCAIGMPAWPTPTGLFKVTGKVKNPAWHNPYSDWSMHMPAVIHGGPNNPLGTRAIYTSAPGIRMHGVPASENWSIGHRASHGCLRMRRHDAEDFYPRVPVGINVWIIK
jgi:lipoprotein-anchoring transpeptidase ErfK/SrfK